MKVKRRNFLLTALAGTIQFAFLKKFIVSSKATAPIPVQTNPILKGAQHQLSVGEVYVAKGFDNILTPIDPKVGDSFFLVIDQKSLPSPAKLVPNNDLIDGLDESLELDCLANIRVTYQGKDQGWKIS